MLKEILLKVISIIRAILRLQLKTMALFLDCLDGIIFANREVCGFEYYFKPQSYDEDKLSYVDQLNNKISPSIPQNQFIIDEDIDENFGDDDEMLK